jgi:hypothetical protein
MIGGAPVEEMVMRAVDHGIILVIIGSFKDMQS